MRAAELLAKAGVDLEAWQMIESEGVRQGYSVGRRWIK